MECQNCPFDAIVKSVSAILDMRTVVIDGKNVPLNAVEYLVHRTKNKNKGVSHEANKLLPVFNKLRTFIETELLPKCQSICMTCSKTSNDDNLSRGGQTFVFMEAMPGAAGEIASDGLGGEAEDNAEEDGNSGSCGNTAEDEFNRSFFEDDGEDEKTATRGNWLNEHVIRGYKKADSPYPNLSLTAESEIRRVLMAFKSLSILQQCVLLLRWNEVSFPDIGSMTWVPPEFKRHNDKQLVTFWWKKIVKKFPLAEELSPKKKKKASGGVSESEDYKSHSPEESYSEQMFDFGSEI